MTDTDLRTEIAATLREVSTDPANADMSVRQFALEAGMRLTTIPAVRVRRVDSAELIGFIHNMYAEHPGQLFGEMADGIVARFGLVEVTR